MTCRHGSLSEFATASSSTQAPKLPHIIEAGWNCQKSEGLFTWMGKHENAWEDDAGTLGMAWKSRTALRQCEQLAALYPDRVDPAATKLLDEAWALQLLAESSDPLGWKPLPSEARFGKAAADAAWRAAAGLLFEWETRCEISSSPVDWRGTGDSAVAPPCVRIRGEGTINWWHGPLGITCGIKLAVGAGENGIEFTRTGSLVSYSPSGLEHTIHVIDISRLPVPQIYLPLANGLIGIGDSWYVVRLNEWGQPCARLSAANSAVLFLSSGLGSRKVYEWRFLLYRGSEEEALNLANRANYI